MLAYHNDLAVKARVLAQIAAHAEADEIVKGQYWQDGKGCAVGCTVHSGEHALYETQFGIPIELVYLEDTIFEGLPNNIAKAWPHRFMASVPVGADLSKVRWHFLHWLLTDKRVNPGIDHDNVRDVIARVAAIMARMALGEDVSQDEIERSAQSASESAAWSAVWSAQSAQSAQSAWSARSAAWSARSAQSAQSAWSAVWSAQSAQSAAYVLMAHKLVELITEATIATEGSAS